MATNSISGDYGFVTQIPCILKEGDITVNSSAYGPFGKMAVCTFASEISKGDVVALSTDPANTADATENNIVVTQLAKDADLAIGRIIDEPKWVRQPAASQNDWAGMLAAGYYRIATVELFIPMSIFKATLVCANASAITPGTTGKLDIDASASQALHGLSVVDVAQDGSSDMIPLTYAAKSANATVSVLVGFKGFGTVTT
jgi:hypothetical protein